MKSYTSNSENETKQIAKNLAVEFNHGVIALSGELGAGKTTFVQGFAKGLGIKERITSPTFVLIRQHKIPKSNKMLYHIDLYRLDDSSQLKNLGIEELINDPDNLLLIEWAEKIQDLLPENATFINFRTLTQNSREITIE